VSNPNDDECEQQATDKVYQSGENGRAKLWGVVNEEGGKEKRSERENVEGNKESSSKGEIKRETEGEEEKKRDGRQIKEEKVLEVVGKVEKTEEAGGEGMNTGNKEEGRVHRQPKISKQTGSCVFCYL
jgi:hypothetical protein